MLKQDILIRRRSFVVGKALFVLLFCVGTSVYSEPPAKQDKELARITKIFTDYFKAADDDERRKIAAELDLVDYIPSVKDISKIIKSVRTYQPIPVMKRTTRKIKVDETEFTYELSPPQNYSVKSASPLIISLHGTGGVGHNGVWIWRIPPEDQEFAREEFVRRYQMDTGKPPPPKDKIIANAPFETNEFIIAAPTLEKNIGDGVQPEILDKLIPSLLDDVLSVCNVDTNRIYIAGYSMGGHIIWPEITAYPDYFAGAIPIMSDAEYVLDYFQNLLNLSIYILHGDKDEIVPVESSRMAYRALQILKYDVTYREAKEVGHHFPPSHSDEGKKVAAWMKSKIRNPFPKKIIYKRVNVMSSPKRLYWLEFPQPLSPGSSIEVEISNNQIDIKFNNLDKLAILLNSDIVDFSKEITIVANDREIYRNKIKPSLRFLLDDFIMNKDDKKLFTARIELPELEAK